MKLRLHRGGYKEAMETVQEVSNYTEILSILKNEFHNIETFDLVDYIKDDRNGWDTFTVIAKNNDGEKFVIGYLDLNI